MSATCLPTLPSVADFLHPEGQVRLELKPPGPITGFVDGAWTAAEPRAVDRQEHSERHAAHHPHGHHF